MPTCIVELVTSLSVSQFFLVSFYHPDGFYILVTAKKTSQEVAWSILVTDLISKIAERTQKKIGPAVEEQAELVQVKNGFRMKVEGGILNAQPVTTLLELPPPFP